MTANVLIFIKIQVSLHQNSITVIQDNTSAWIQTYIVPLRAILHLRKISKCNTKRTYYSLKWDCQYVNIVSKFRFKPIKGLSQ